MSQYIETIRIQHGRIQNLKWHNYRFNKTRNEHLDLNQNWDLRNFIYVSSLDSSAIYKCRIIYSHRIESIEYLVYKKPEIKSLRVIIDDDINYEKKYLDRNQINQHFDKRGRADDILIIKNGFITDSSYCNVALYNGTSWLTPKTPLLNGTQRSKAIEEASVQVAPIKLKEITSFDKLALFNAMIPFEDRIEIAIENILI